MIVDSARTFVTTANDIKLKYGNGTILTMNKVLTKIVLILAELKPIIKDDPNPFQIKYFDINTVHNFKPILSKPGVTVNANCLRWWMVKNGIDGDL